MFNVTVPVLINGTSIPLMELFVEVAVPTGAVIPRISRFELPSTSTLRVKVPVTPEPELLIHAAIM